MTNQHYELFALLILAAISGCKPAGQEIRTGTNNFLRSDTVYFDLSRLINEAKDIGDDSTLNAVYRYKAFPSHVTRIAIEVVSLQYPLVSSPSSGTPQISMVSTRLCSDNSFSERPEIQFINLVVQGVRIDVIDSFFQRNAIYTLIFSGSGDLFDICNERGESFVMHENGGKP